MTGTPWDRLKVDRVHLTPRALDLSPAHVRRQYGSVWEPLTDYLHRIRACPDGLLRFWQRQLGGHVVITHLASQYNEGEMLLKSGSVRNVAQVCLANLAGDSLEALVPLGRLLDHLLGSGGAPDGKRLSDGEGVCRRLQRLGGRIQRLFPLGHGFDAPACQDAQSYFARSVALYLHDRRALNTADPLMERLLRTTLFGPAFWESLEP